jgi:hypothetical protein
MKTFALTVATALFALTADAKTVEEKLEAKKLSQTQWPAIKYYRSFKMTETLYQWNNATLSRYYDVQGTSFVDGYRSKVLTNAAGRIDTFNTFEVTALTDLKNNYMLSNTKINY